MDLLDDGRCQSFGWFVEHQEVRRGDECAGDGEHLLFAAGESRALARSVPREVFELVDNLVDGRLVDVLPTADTADFDVFGDCQSGEDATLFGNERDAFAGGLLGGKRGDVRLAEGDCPRRGRHAPEDASERRRLADAVATDERDDRAFWNVEVDTLKDARRTVSGDESPNREQRVGTHASTPPKYASRTSGSSETASGDPSASISPLWSTVIRSETRITRSISCSMRSSVRSESTSSMRSIVARVSSALMPAVGSSSRTISGSVASTIAISRRRLSP
ncbi:hypothetical protein HFX_6371 (plasmid) [Haloferax mediterranei ATCC 33500]|uniref:Uncharacterized protein n=1 Tax=Haloferax mediterranei (strain ATCC 33500 / DSM 1411 / JCM 8866 / NBRC 14739 / NCIMB 2177 / R-4) TaxID=523841 RepID=I3RB80_HALMT|nr:hypothetical protein HFX_6371 [Haloferax mediterranei ATCC 33500]